MLTNPNCISRPPGEGFRANVNVQGPLTATHETEPAEYAIEAGLEDYYGIWAVEEARFRAMMDRFGTFEFIAHFAQSSRFAADRSSGVDYSITKDGIAVIQLRGVLMKHYSSFFENTSTVLARIAIRNAAENRDVRGIMVVVDSPGGTVAGTDSLAAEIEAAGKVKPLHAFVEDIATSAAYWAIAPAAVISAGPTALVGSIGVFSVIEDHYERADKAGIKVHVIKSGGPNSMKGAGVTGTRITPAHLVEARRVVDGLAEHFYSAVRNGRKIPIATVSDGRAHMAAGAKKLGLIDRVSSFDEAFEGLKRRVGVGK